MIIDHHPAGNYMFKVNNRNTRARCETNMRITFAGKSYDILFIRCKLKCYSHHFIIYMS